MWPACLTTCRSLFFLPPPPNSRAAPTPGTSQFISRLERSFGTGSKRGRGKGIAFPFINLDEGDRDPLPPPPSPTPAVECSLAEGNLEDAVADLLGEDELRVGGDGQE